MNILTPLCIVLVASIGTYESVVRNQNPGRSLTESINSLLLLYIFSAAGIFSTEYKVELVSVLLLGLVIVTLFNTLSDKH